MIGWCCLFHRFALKVSDFRLGKNSFGFECEDLFFQGECLSVAPTSSCFACHSFHSLVSQFHWARMSKALEPPVEGACKGGCYDRGRWDVRECSDFHLTLLISFRWLSGEVQHLSWRYHPSPTMRVKYNHLTFSFIPLRERLMILWWNLLTLHNCMVVRVFRHPTSTILSPYYPPQDNSATTSLPKYLGRSIFSFPLIYRVVATQIFLECPPRKLGVSWSNLTI